MIELRMRGASPVLIASALIAIAPLGFCLYELRAAHRPVLPLLVMASALVAAMPWLSRVAARLSYRAAVDDFALHVGGEALPWNKITAVETERSWRRTSMIFHRGDTLSVRLVVRDLFAGRLEPFGELTGRLPASVFGALRAP